MDSSSHRVYDCIRDLFDRVTEVSFDLHPEVEALKRLLVYDSCFGLNYEDQLVEFCESFIHFTRIVLISNKSETPFWIQFISEFLASLSSESDNTDENRVQNELLTFLMRNNKASSDRVRCHIYEILGKFLEMTQKNRERMSIDECVFVKMQKCLSEGVRDRFEKAQTNAIRAAYSLQSPRDPNCPIISSYLHLLKHDSLKTVRLQILDLIVINELTLEFFRTQLVFDSDSDVLNRLVRIVIKKVPNQYVDASFRRNLIECVLFRNENRDLTERLLYKWLNITKPYEIVSFISSLDLEKEWFTDSDPKIMAFMDSKLTQVMDIIYNMFLSDSNHHIDVLISSLRPYMAIEKLVTDSASAVYYRSLVTFVSKLKLSGLLDLEHASNLLNEILSSKITIRPVILFNLIEAVFCFDLIERNRDSLKKLAKSVRHSEDLEFVYECIVTKFDVKYQVEFLWKYYSGYIRFGYESGHLKKLLTLFSIIMAQLDDSSIDKVDKWVQELDSDALFDDSEQDVIEHWVKNLLLNNIMDLDPHVRMLVARGLGIVSLANSNLWTVFSDMFIKMILNDYPQVVIEAQKALFNIVLFFSNQVSKTKDEKILYLWNEILDTLENQFDCLNENIYYVTCEGFAKLLINRCSLENRDKLLTCLIIAYMTTSHDGGSKSAVNKKLLACLNSFLHVFKKVNLSALVGSFLPTLKFLISKQSNTNVLRRLAKLFYFLTSGTKNQRQALMLSLLREMFDNIDDYMYIQRMIEILIEFRIHQCDVKNLQLLNDVYTQLQLILIKFKSEKWKMTREEEMKELIADVKKLIVVNEEEAEKENSATKRASNTSSESSVKYEKIPRLH